MHELTRTLWEYAQKCRLKGCYDLNMKREREEGEETALWNRDRLEKTSAASKELEILWNSMELVRLVDMEAAFVCGLHLGLSLR